MGDAFAAMAGAPRDAVLQEELQGERRQGSLQSRSQLVILEGRRAARHAAVGKRRRLGQWPVRTEHQPISAATTAIRLSVTDAHYPELQMLNSITRVGASAAAVE